ncbi:outer membrane protein [Asaia krungthepensis NRIC 0535]|uniref:Outer membrane protein n=2 Tax=Asaia krungthepensis TaxID=220990 RepID=A0ABQ0PZN0_9PROT|nr:outer membrane protein [Asaia krungthepensis NRIC 0535]
MNGATVFQSNNTSLLPPVELAVGTTVYIKNGAVVSGLNSYAVNIYVSSGGMLADSTIIDGGLTTYAGGATSGNFLNSIPTNIYSGGTSLNDTWYNSGYGEDGINILSGATVGDITCGNGAVINIQKGVTIQGDVTVSSGGNLTTYAGFGREVIIPDVPAPSTGTRLQGVWSAVKMGNATVYLSNNTIVRAPVALANGATIYVQSGAVASNLSGYAVNIYVSNGGTLTHSYIRDGGFTVYNGGTSSENLFDSIPTNIYPGGHSINDTWYNTIYGQDPALIHSGAIVDNPQIGSGGAMSGAWGAIINTPAVANGGVLWANHTTVTACFLRGTLIQTEHGEVPVDKLQPGDPIACVTPDGIVYRPARSIEREQNMLQPHLPVDQSGYPVRICAGALSDNTPHTDLLVTAEHCLLLEGKFVPVRMLVNDRTITYDTTRPVYDYYHIELEEHAIIIANGVETESFLDTGEAMRFATLRQAPAGKTWKTDGAAPLETGREAIEPLYRKIAERASELFGVHLAGLRQISHDSRLTLATDKGDLLKPLRWNGQICVFRLPPGVASVRIISRTGRPCDSIGPFVDDRRRLGVKIAEIMHYSPRASVSLTSHLQNPVMEGWHEIEGGPSRWTDGMGHLSLDTNASLETSLLSLKIEETPGYVEAIADPDCAMAG